MIEKSIFNAIPPKDAVEILYDIYCSTSDGNTKALIERKVLPVAKKNYADKIQASSAYQELQARGIK